MQRTLLIKSVSVFRHIIFLSVHLHRLIFINIFRQKSEKPWGGVHKLSQIQCIHFLPSAQSADSYSKMMIHSKYELSWAALFMFYSFSSTKSRMGIVLNQQVDINNVIFILFCFSYLYDYLFIIK